MKYTNEQLKKIQDIEIEIAREIVRVCEKNDISFFTIGGTTLGAIRHNGFIPWDDDMDIGMCRKDYDRFLSVAPQQLSNGFIIQHYQFEQRTPTYHAKVMKTGTQFVESYAERIAIPHCVFVDIMPFDNIPSDQGEVNKYRRSVKRTHQLFIAKSVWKTSLTRGVKKYLYTVLRIILHILLKPVPKKYLYKKLEQELRKYNGIETERMSSRGLEVFECNKMDVFPTVKHQFESLVLPIPRNAERLLKHQYGDFMKLPPENQRVGHAPKILKV